MTLRSEIEQLFDEAREKIRKRTTPPGVLPREGDPHPSAVVTQENFAAISKALLLIADRLDRDPGAMQEL